MNYKEMAMFSLGMEKYNKLKETIIAEYLQSLEPLNGDEWKAGYKHGAWSAQRELSDEEIDAAWRSVDYTQPYSDFRIAIARAVLEKARTI